MSMLPTGFPKEVRFLLQTQILARPRCQSDNHALIEPALKPVHPHLCEE